MLSEPARLSDAIANAPVVAIAGISWYELAWLFDAGALRSMLIPGHGCVMPPRVLLGTCNETPVRAQPALHRER